METVVDGVKIHYRMGGQGIPVLFLHGSMCEIDTFAPVLQYVEQRGNQWVALDFPGFSPKSSQPPPEPWSVTEYAQLAHRFLLQLGLPPCDIIAHSFGARVAIILAAEHPEQIGKMVFTGAAGLIPKRGLDYHLRVTKYKLGKKLARVGWLNRLFKIDQRQASAGSSEYQSFTGTMRGTFVRVVNQNLRPYLPRIKASTLLVWGSEDDATPLWMGEEMERLIPDAGLVVFQGRGHYAFLEECGRFCNVIDVFLRR